MARALSGTIARLTNCKLQILFISLSEKVTSTPLYALTMNLQSTKLQHSSREKKTSKTTGFLRGRDSKQENMTLSH